MERFHLEWSADLTWFAHKSRLITGFEVKAGDYLVGLREEGLRCNGISLIRKILRTAYGDQWHDMPFGGTSLINSALHPSRIYTSAVVAMTGGYDLNRPAQAILHGAAHITGGGNHPALPHVVAQPRKRDGEHGPEDDDDGHPLDQRDAAPVAERRPLWGVERQDPGFHR